MALSRESGGKNQKYPLLQITGYEDIISFEILNVF